MTRASGARARSAGDAFESLSLVIPGPPRTKKNSGRIVPHRGAHIILPSKAWETWCAFSQPWLTSQMKRAGIALVDFPVNCRALFYRDALRGDACGFYQGLADALENAGVVANDRWIVSWDGSRLLKDASNPRVEVMLTRIIET